MPRAARVCLIVTGGIAAYKAPDVVRRLREQGAEVRVVMTRAAREFVQPLTFQAVSGNPVAESLLDPAAEAAMGHIELARWADVLLIAPATADFLARLRLGLADDLATTLCLAATAPIVAAPAMNQQMWQSAATRDNVAALQARGVRLVGPDAGSQACGEVGPGRMAEPADVARQALAVAGSGHVPGPLAGIRVLVTAGPTQEPIDPVRFLSNRSSGRMGYAVARAAREAGAAVCLVSGPTHLPQPMDVDFCAVKSAAEMHEAVLRRVADCDVFVAAAAVADYRIEAPATEKLKKSDALRSLTLVPTHDILRAVAARPKPPFTVGFAAETNDVLDNARAKLVSKALNLVAANDVGRPGIGFDSEDNELHVIWDDGGENLGRASKDALARRLVAIIGERYRAWTARQAQA